MNIGTPELIIVLVIVILLFGSGRIAQLGGELGSALREFKRGLNGEERPSDKTPQNPTR